MVDFSLVDNPIGYENLTTFVVSMINFAMNLSILIATIALIAAGFKYILAMGDEEKTENATKSLIFALVGLVVVFIAPLVVEYLTGFLMIK